MLVLGILYYRRISIAATSFDLSWRDVFIQSAKKIKFWQS